MSLEHAVSTDYPIPVSLVAPRAEKNEDKRITRKDNRQLLQLPFALKFAVKMWWLDCLSE